MARLDRTDYRVEEISNWKKVTGEIEYRYLPAPQHIDFLTPLELLDSYLVEGLLESEPAHFCATDLDRLVIAGIIPQQPWALPAFSEFGTASFHERRESGILNLGGSSLITVDGQEYKMGRFDCLYIGRGAKEVIFHAAGPGEDPAAYYLLSCPAHQAYPVARLGFEDATVREVGDAETCSRRKIRQYIHDCGLQSCQLVMGFTEVPAGSVWNTMPPHQHSRRSEIYFYFDLQDRVVVHLMGEPQNTRHLIVHDRQAVLSPPWSIHCGTGTGSYRFVWGMAGENKSFDDMDPVAIANLR